MTARGLNDDTMTATGALLIWTEIVIKISYLRSWQAKFDCFLTSMILSSIEFDKEILLIVCILAILIRDVIL